MDGTTDAPSGQGLVVDDLVVEVRLEDGWRPIVDGVRLNARPGETVGLVGESGSGKSVTGLAALGLLSPSLMRISRGSVMLGGRELVGMSERNLSKLRGSEISMVFQEPMTSLNPSLTIGTQVGEIVRRHRGVSARQAETRVVEVLDQVGIPRARERLHAYPHEFSGGMRQRVVIAAAIACDPKVLIADEPTTALDVTIQAQILALLRRMTDELNLATVLITHDMSVVADVCDRVSVMYAGQIVEEGDVFEMFDAMKHPYTRGLLDAVPARTASVETLGVIPGSPPAPRDWGIGCRFAPRCPYAAPECTAPQELMAVSESGHTARCIRSRELELTTRSAQ